MPRRISAATISAWRSEKLRTRSGFRSRIFGMSADVKAETRGIVTSSLWRPHAITRDSDDAILFAKQIKGFDGLLGQADDPLCWKHPVALPDLRGVRPTFVAVVEQSPDAVRPDELVCRMAARIVHWLKKRSNPAGNRSISLVIRAGVDGSRIPNLDRCRQIASLRAKSLRPSSGGRVDRP